MAAQNCPHCKWRYHSKDNKVDFNKGEFICAIQKPIKSGEFEEIEEQPLCNAVNHLKCDYFKKSVNQGIIVDTSSEVQEDDDELYSQSKNLEDLKKENAKPKIGKKIKTGLKKKVAIDPNSFDPIFVEDNEGLPLPKIGQTIDEMIDGINKSNKADEASQDAVNKFYSELNKQKDETPKNDNKTYDFLDLD